MKTLTIAEAERSLRSLAHRALRGEQVLIQVEGSSERLSLHSVSADLPENYLAECYGPEEITQDDYLASLSPRGTAT